MHKFIHACAGSGKTESIVRKCSDNGGALRRLVLTLTTSGQDELESRVKGACGAKNLPDVMGWYTFLIRHIIRPYLPLKFPKQRVEGFQFSLEDRTHRWRYNPKSNKDRYFTSQDFLFRDSIEELAAEILKDASGKVEHRLSRIYHEILIDEAQDISRAGLDVIDALLCQNAVSVTLVGDTRQSLLDSSLSSAKNKKADRLGLLNWYRQRENSSFVKIEHLAESYRFNQLIADFSDQVFPKELGFEPTVSKMLVTTGHDGIFLVEEKYLDRYCATFDPVLLRHSRSSGKHLDSFQFATFGAAKGRTYDRVAIYTTQPMRDLLSKRKPLAEKSACEFYVGLTRAKYSVALIVKTASKNLRESTFGKLELWTPDTGRDS